VFGNILGEFFLKHIWSLWSAANFDHFRVKLLSRPGVRCPYWAMARYMFSDWLEKNSGKYLLGATNFPWILVYIYYIYRCTAHYS
jgi:hypothetical protein